MEDKGDARKKRISKPVKALSCQVDEDKKKCERKYVTG
jgi:hypothetical protein